MSAASATPITATPTKTAPDASSTVAASVSSPPRLTTTALAIAPSTAAPTAWPMVRANRLVPVTTPRSCHGALDCAATRLGMAVNPIPSPTNRQNAATIQGDGGQATTATASPTVDPSTSRLPPIAVRRKPHRK